MVTGVWIAGLEISANRYLAQGLWHTALWLGSHGAIVGAMVGVGVGAFLAVWMAPRRPAVSVPPPADGPARATDPTAEAAERRLALAMILTSALALAIVLLPAEAPEILGRPARAVFGAGLFVFWAVTAASLLSRTSEESPPAGSVEGVWTILVWLGYIVALSHLWSRVAPGLLMGELACVGLLGAVAVYSALGRPVQSLVRFLGRRVRRPVALLRLRRLSAAVLAVGGVLWVAGASEALRVRAGVKRSHPNLLIIAVDTLRADRVNLVSKPTSGWDLTPNLRERLAPHGTYFTRAHSQASWTMPAFASIFTGLYPEQHGAEMGESRLLPDRLTLAEMLRDGGYQTTAVVSGEYVSSNVGMLQGFDVRDESQALGLGAITSRQVTDRALSLLAAQHSEPFFLFVHYFDPHWTYQDHPELRFAKGRFRGVTLPYKLKQGKDTAGGLFVQEVGEVKALYAEEIAFTDLHIGRLLAFLDEHHLWDSTCVVFVADHGEEFLEHGSYEHESTLFEEVLRVPLFIADPTRHGPTAVDDLVETRWLFGTILEVLGFPRPAAAAYSLFSPPRDDGYHVRGSLYGGQQTCLIGRRYKLSKGIDPATVPGLRKPWQRVSGRTQKAPTARPPGSHDALFDLLKDPGETRDLSEELPEVSQRLRSTLEAINSELSRRRETAPMPRLSEDQKRKLRALGYL